jgi:hypothetical protein
VSEDERIVAVSLLTAEEVRVVGQCLKHVYPVPADQKFDDLLRALDQPIARAGPRQFSH